MLWVGSFDGRGGYGSLCVSGECGLHGLVGEMMIGALFWGEVMGRMRMRCWVGCGCDRGGSRWW